MYNVINKYEVTPNIKHRLQYEHDIRGFPSEDFVCYDKPYFQELIMKSKIGWSSPLRQCNLSLKLFVRQTVYDQ